MKCTKFTSINVYIVATKRVSAGVENAGKRLFDNQVQTTFCQMRTFLILKGYRLLHFLPLLPVKENSHKKQTYVVRFEPLQIQVNQLQNAFVRRVKFPSIVAFNSILTEFNYWPVVCLNRGFFNLYSIARVKQSRINQRE